MHSRTAYLCTDPGLSKPREREGGEAAQACQAMLKERYHDAPRCPPIASVVR